tara:strand:- start:614 stop:1069 length:456 start_codon:yes stop_codon:yes gene_type:complete
MEKMSYNKWKRKRDALEDAFARKMLLDYDIREVTTRLQAKNGTREFEFPVSTFDGKHNWYRKWQVYTGRKPLKNIKLRLAVFKSGYVRRQNGCYCAYPINKRYKREERMTFLNGDGELKTFKTNVLAYEKINSMLASMNYMLNYYLKNYKK